MLAGNIGVGVRRRLHEAVGVAQEAAARVALADCNRRCKVDTGALRASSLVESNLREGRLVWRAEYARAAYFTGRAGKTKNPEAVTMWAHRAAIVHKKEWLAAAKEAFVRHAEG